MHIAYTLTKGNFNLSVDITLPENGITVIFGPSGCGKTTLLRCIAGLEPAAQGTFIKGGQAWQSQKVNLPPFKRSVGFVFQEAALFNHLSVRKNIYYGWKRIAPADRRDLGPIIGLLGIGNLLDRKPHELSGGQMQRVGIARALAVSPQLLLLDEPFSSLDNTKKNEILPYLEKLRDAVQIPIFYVTHSIAEVARLADFVVMIKGGVVVLQGKLPEVFTNVASVMNREEVCSVIF
jgi:molybdate transport system ATP-binding protein